jgi:hypothetical protein
MRHALQHDGPYDRCGQGWLRRIMAGADLLVLHANDRLKMRQWRCRLPGAETLPVVDTGTWYLLTVKEGAHPRRLPPLRQNMALNARACMWRGMTR